MTPLLALGAVLYLRVISKSENSSVVMRSPAPAPAVEESTPFSKCHPLEGNEGCLYPRQSDVAFGPVSSLYPRACSSGVRPAAGGWAKTTASAAMVSMVESPG